MLATAELFGFELDQLYQDYGGVWMAQFNGAEIASGATKSEALDAALDAAVNFPFLPIERN